MKKQRRRLYDSICIGPHRYRIGRAVRADYHAAPTEQAMTLTLVKTPSPPDIEPIRTLCVDSLGFYLGHDYLDERA